MKLTKLQRQILEAVPHENESPMSTADIASSVRQMTHWIASTIRALEKKGMIRCTFRGKYGVPSEFVTTPAGRAALSEGSGE